MSGALEIGDRRNVGTTLGDLGNACARLGEAERAIGYHEEHVVIAREIGDRQGEGNALGGVAAWRKLLLAGSGRGARRVTL